MLTVTLTGDGIEKLGTEVQVKFSAVIDSLPADDAIENEASVIINDGQISYITDPDKPTTTILADLTINKVGKDQQLITTGSAKFELWRCEAEGDGYKVVGEKLSAATSATDATTVTNEFTTVNGQANLYGVQAMDFVNGVDVDGGLLCAVETQAPEGYSLNPAPVPVNYADETNASGYDMVVSVINLTEEEAGSGQLPSTGGQGTMALIAAGVLVAAAGGAASVRANRARR